jgi:hypothetical protein
MRQAADDQAQPGAFKAQPKALASLLPATIAIANPYYTSNLCFPFLSPGACLARSLVIDKAGSSGTAYREEPPSMASGSDAALRLLQGTATEDEQLPRLLLADPEPTQRSPPPHGSPAAEAPASAASCGGQDAEAVIGECTQDLLDLVPDSVLDISPGAADDGAGAYPVLPSLTTGTDVPAASAPQVSAVLLPGTEAANELHNPAVDRVSELRLWLDTEPGDTTQPAAVAQAVSEEQQLLPTSSHAPEDDAAQRLWDDDNEVPSSAPCPSAARLWDDEDELDALLEDEREFTEAAAVSAVPPQTVPAARAQTWRPPPPLDDPLQDVDAELAELDALRAEYDAECDTVNGQALTTAAAAQLPPCRAADLDLDAELDALLAGDSAAAQEAAGDGDAPPEDQAPKAATTTLRPATLASLGADASLHGAAVLLALRASTVPPRALASDVCDVPNITVTGSDGRRVYCELHQQAPLEQPASGRARHGAHTTGGAGGLGGLLDTPLPLLQEMLAERRRQVCGMCVCVCQCVACVFVPAGFPIVSSLCQHSCLCSSAAAISSPCSTYDSPNLTHHTAGGAAAAGRGSSRGRSRRGMPAGV